MEEFRDENFGFTVVYTQRKQRALSLLLVSLCHTALVLPLLLSSVRLQRNISEGQLRGNQSSPVGSAGVQGTQDVSLPS